MLVTKHAAELCALLVNDLYGELPSRILIALLTKGRSTIAQLVQHTSLTPRHLRNGLAVLIQQNLLYHHTNPDTNVISYEANAGACYSLVRSGKILEIVDRQYGTAERELVQTLMLLGHARIADLAQAFGSRAPKTNGHTNGNHDSHNGLIESENHLNSVLGRLLRAEIIETVRPDSFRNPTDVRREIEDDVLKTAPGEKAASKNKAESQRQIIDRFRTFRDQGRMLKRQLDATGGFVSKRRKLENGRTQNGHSYEEDAPQINPNVVVRLNHERCLVELRNQRLSDLAADILGEVTGEVYRAALDLLTAEFSRCRPDALLDEETNSQQVAVTSVEILEHLDESINVQFGIGKAAKDKIDSESAERVRTAPPDEDYDSDDSDAAPPGRRPVLRTFDIGDDDDGDEDEVPSGAANGDRETKVKFEGAAAPKDSRLSQMRQHLLLLAESKQQFIRHCGTFGRGQWTVDFSQLMARLRETELDAMIEQCHGRYGLRLTRILREKGKLDEKMLPSAALMKKSDVQGKMLAMQMAGLVDVQEVPRDNSRLANRTLFFWFFDKERSQSQALDDIYKAMLRCLQTLQVERHKERNILSFVERKDVQGKEEEVMTAEHYNKYNMHLEVQNKLLGQVMKLDELVAMLRDY
ncbi:RNA polymerase III subunit RPC82-domain-containing protein [Dactylonectria macrodidyma]|uniref:DNA-directed RNA polymerase III subunit RPC3 n=1 Tax=Dactylonectria macrodidyma TaxID=307937 RepID=A0A9P9F9Z3_9HYPO|nr:RNA polymerase III subunit RPC82-domain-containing protein [Dactylonectria macrodidyma]